MPYIKKSRRQALVTLLHQLDHELYTLGDAAGDLNYVFTSLIISQFKRKVCYDTINRLMGVFASAKSEFYWRHVVPYEKGKVQENGDVDELEVQIREVWK